jgi:transposase InsO family protein
MPRGAVILAGVRASARKRTISIASPAYIVIKAAEEFRKKTAAPNQLWQTNFTYLKITGWGWYYLSTVLDDFSRFIVAHGLVQPQQLAATPHDAQHGVDRPKIAAERRSIATGLKLVQT